LLPGFLPVSRTAIASLFILNKSLYILAVLFLIAGRLYSQELPTDIKFTTYTRANGLPEEHLSNVKQDSRGFLWIGSSEGLFRFDGKNFKDWYANSADSTAFNRNTIAVAGEYKKGFMLIATPILWQINIYNQKIERLPSFKNKETVFAVTKINNSQWFVSDLDSLYITDAALTIQKKFEVAKYYPPKTAVACFPLQYPYVLIFPTTQMKLYLLNYVTNEIKPFNIDIQLNKNSPFVLPKFYDSTTRKLYLNAYFDGFYCIDLQIPAVTNYSPRLVKTVGDASSRAALLINPRLVMQGGDMGLNISNFEKNVFFNQSSALDKPMTAGPVVDIYKDRQENIWVSTANGLNRFSFRPPTINYLKNELHFKTKDAFTEILKGQDGNIYFLTQGKSLYQLNKKNNSVTRLDSTIGYTWSAIANKNTIIATGGGKRIVVYDIATGKTSNPAYLNPFYGTADLVTLVFKAANGDLWYSINAGGGLVRNPGGTSKYIHYFNGDNPPAFSHRHLHCAVEDSKGNIWFGYIRNNNLLKWVSALQKFEEYPVTALLKNFSSNAGLKNLFIDSKDNLWMVLDGMALLRYNIITKTGRYYDMNDGLPTESVSGICEDGKGRLWVTTTKGLGCFLPEKDKFTTFTVSDGLPEDKFPGEGIFYDKEDQLIYAGAETSIAWFNPDSLLQKAIKAQPPVFIDEMLVNGQKYFFTDEKNIQLRSSENNIEFTIAAPDFYRNDQLAFQYKLKGAGNEWINLGVSRTVTFNNLLSGKYEFSVRSKYRGNDRWNETEFPFTFTIATPWYNTWWFILLVITGGAFLAWYLIKSYYSRKLEQQRAFLEKQQAVETERTRIATDMHDDFGASLSRIKFLSEKIKIQNQEKELLRKDLDKISDYSDEMAEKMNEIVWALNQKYDSLGDLIAFCRAYASDYLSSYNIQLHFTDNNLPDVKIQGEIRRNIFLVMKESLHNIIKHAGASIVHITFGLNGVLNLQITDNGRGIDLDKMRPFANGLQNMKKRIASIHGIIAFENNNGTVISINVPLN
jgi:signal transduction histidine kinase/ligand-binding sensor domain-containing protein